MEPGSRTQQPERHATSGGTSLVVMVTGLVALTVGLMAGIDMATKPRVPAYTYAGVVGAALPGALLMLGLVVTVIVGAIALAVRRWWLVACFMLGAGYIGGFVGGMGLAQATGHAWVQPPIVYPSMPIVHGALGTASGRLDGVPGFVARTGGAECRSGIGSEAVATVSAQDAGRLRGAVLRASLSLHGVGTDPGLVGIPGIYLWSPDMTGAWPTWTGQGRLVESGPLSGRVTFQDLAAVPTRDAQPGTWPTTLSGEISWTCEPWASGVPGAIEVPPTVP